MQLVARVTFVVLVGATFAAFFVAQRLKSAPPVLNVNLTQYFSPNGDGERDASRISLFLKKPDEATIDVVNLDGDAVRRLASNVPMKAYRPYRTVWDGKDDAGVKVAGRPVPPARLIARRGSLGHRAEDDAGGHASAEVAGSASACAAA